MPCASSLPEYDLPTDAQLGLPMPVQSFDITSILKGIRSLCRSQNLDLSAKHWGSSGYRKQVGTAGPALNSDLLWEAVRPSGT